MKSGILPKLWLECHLSSNPKGHDLIACRVSPKSSQGAEPVTGPQVGQFSKGLVGPSAHKPP